MEDTRDREARGKWSVLQRLGSLKFCFAQEESYSVPFPKHFAFCYPGACSTILPKMHCKQGEKDRERVRELIETGSYGG